MDGRGGCCIARYSGVGGISYGVSKVEKIMLKFRPIAPKPMADGSGSSCSTMENSNGYGRIRRRKRKYVRVNRGNKNKKETDTVSKKRKASASSSSVSGGGDAVATLSLIPETPDRDEKSQAKTSPSEILDLLSSVLRNKPAPNYCDTHVREETGHVVSVTDVIASPPPPLPRSQVDSSIVMMECVAETWLNGEGLGLTDEARVMNMEMDPCPWFITNSHDTVVWTNKAYREFTADGGPDEPDVVMVNKYNPVKMPVSLQSFACKVKVTWWPERTSSSPLTLTAPCDVWRLRNGGYAWRLDVKAALSLGW